MDCRILDPGLPHLESRITGSQAVEPMIRKTSYFVMAALLTMAARAAVAAEENAEPPRAARSVHLGYPAPEAAVFYNELTVEQSVPGSYFMACGFSHGYFGIQELGDGKKVVIFSVWDPTKGDDPNARARGAARRGAPQGRRRGRPAVRRRGDRRAELLRLRLEARPDVPFPGQGRARRRARPPTPPISTCPNRRRGSTWSPSARRPAATASRASTRSSRTSAATARVPRRSAGPRSATAGSATPRDMDAAGRRPGSPPREPPGRPRRRSTPAWRRAVSICRPAATRRRPRRWARASNAPPTPPRRRRCHRIDARSAKGSERLFTRSRPLRTSAGYPCRLVRQRCQ